MQHSLQRAVILSSSFWTSIALAGDLSVAGIEITQGWQDASNATTLVAKNATAVRVRIAVTGQTTAQANVDAVLRIYSNGVEIAGSPVYSTNGPITAPITPNTANINDTLNFICLPPQSNDVDFVVTVNPFRTVVETNYANNTFALNNRVFACRKMVDIAYTPVNYTLGGGLPSATVIEPGNGDAFLRGIYKTGDWNYHRSPLTPPILSTDINSTSSTLLNTLSSIRQTTIPAAGYQRPEFIYGWLPGNPFSGNGQAIGIPGDAAFGNTENSRYQRTFAHEIGHCWGLSHNTSLLGTIGFDVEHQLRDPLNIAQVMPTTKKDIMYAGLLTPEAWVASGSYLDCINDARSACSAVDGGENGSGGATDAMDGATSVLRITGVHDHVARSVQLDHAMTNELVVPTADNPRGNVLVESFDADGALLSAVRVDTRGCRESCRDPRHAHRQTPLFVNLPRWVDGREAASIVVREFGARGVSGPSRVLASLVRSQHAPVVDSLELASIAVALGQAVPNPSAMHGPVRLTWNATDLDGDTLVSDLLYSPDGGNAWLPVAVGVQGTTFDFDAADLPASRGANARFRVRVSDGVHTSESETSGASYFGNSAPPDVHVIGPNTQTTFPAGATVVLHGSAWDIDDQLLPESGLTWTSSRDGALGSGRFVVRRNLTVGTHVVTLRGTDSGGLFTEKTITISVTARVYNNGDFDGNSNVGAEDLAVLLNSWGGNGIADLDLDGVVGPADLSMLLGAWN